jgi:GTP-binding protein HflX
VEVVESVLRELSLDKKPMIKVYNKVDLLGPSVVDGNGIRISARRGIGLERLLRAIEEKLSEDFKLVRLRIPYAESGKLNWLYRVGEVRSRKDLGDGIHLKVALRASDAARLRAMEEIRVRAL